MNQMTANIPQRQKPLKKWMPMGVYVPAIRR